MAAVGLPVWEPGAWADTVWASGVWEDGVIEAEPGIIVMARATQTIQAGGLVVLDPANSEFIQFDWDSKLADDAEISTSTWTIVAIKQSGETALTKDNETIVTGGRKVQARFISTTASEGDKYWVNSKIVTNESPAQTIEQRFKVLIQNQ